MEGHVFDSQKHKRYFSDLLCNGKCKTGLQTQNKKRIIEIGLQMAEKRDILG